MKDQEKTLAAPAEATQEPAEEIATPQLVSLEKSVKKCFMKSWKLFTDDKFMVSGKLRTVRALAALLLGIAMMFAMKWTAKFSLGLQTIAHFQPEDLTWKDRFLMLQTPELWLCLGLLLAGTAFCIYHRSMKQKMLAALVEPSEPQSLTKGFGKKVQLGLVLSICNLLVTVIASMPVVFLFLSYYQSESAVAIGDTVAGIPTIDYSSAAVCAAVVYLLLSLAMLNSIAWKLLDRA